MTDKMAGKNMMDRRGRGKDAQTAGVAMPVTGFGRSFYRRLIGAILALSLVFNSVSFAVDGYSPRRALSEESIYAPREDYANKENGGQKVYTGDKARQDIFLAGYIGKDDDGDKLAASISVTGTLSDPNGSGGGWIWVWAETPDTYDAANHYEMLKQFATYTGETIDEGTLHAFRNAQDDEATVYSADGQTPVKLRDTDGKPVSFVDAQDVAHAELKGLPSGANGAFFIGSLPYGTYYLHETVIPSGYGATTAGGDGNWFILTVNEDGAGYEQTSGTLLKRLEPQADKP